MAVPGDLDLTGACRVPRTTSSSPAMEGHAHGLVSSDKDLLDMKRCRGAARRHGQFLLALELLRSRTCSSIQGGFDPVSGRSGSGPRRVSLCET